MNRAGTRVAWACAVAAAVALAGRAEAAPDAADPYGLMIRPVPEKTVVLTFDDACLSHAEFVGPLLKAYGFGATFYVTRFGNPALDPAKYMTWPAIKKLEGLGFEIGNHTWSHSQMGGGSTVKGFIREAGPIEALCLSNSIARPTTFCWPIYSVGPQLFATLSERGYLFGRSGGRNDRPYTPTVENPFETPSFTILAKTPVEVFTSAARRATRGRIPIYTFHGVPDIEHPGVGVEPERFKEMMKYLKDHQYTVIAMRDLARYVDSKKAARLLPVPAVKPDVGIADPAQLAASHVFESPKAVCDVKVSGAAMEFGGSGKGRVVLQATLGNKAELTQAAPYLLELLPQAGANELAGVSVRGSALQASPQGLGGAPLRLQDAVLRLEDPMNTWKEFASPTTLAGSNTVQSLDGNRAVLTGKMTGSGSVTYTGFYPVGRVSSDSDYTGDTRIAQDEWFGQNPDDRQGHDDLMFGISGARPFGTGRLTIAGKVGTRMGRAWFGGNENAIPNAVTLETCLVFNGRSTINLSGAVSGPGSLVWAFNAKDASNTLKLRGDNSYSGGTRFFSGTLEIGCARALGTGPVVLGGKSPDPKHAVRLCNLSAMAVANAVELAGITDATVDGSCPTFAGSRGEVANDPAAAAEFNTAGGGLTLSGPVSGSGGLLKTGAHALVLAGANSYSGPTTISQGTLSLTSARGLGKSTDLAVSEGAALELNFKGELRIGKLTLDGKRQPAGAYQAASVPKFITGTGVLKVQ